MKWCADFVAHHGNEMTTRALGRVHEVARPFELRKRRLVPGNRLGKLRFTSPQRTLARPHGTSQRPDVAANGKDALLVHDDTPP